MLAFGLLTAVLAAVASALPAAKRAPGAWCNGLGGGAFDSLSNFTLAAYNATGINTNTTGAPLVLGSAGAISGAELKDLATFASFPFNQYPSIALSEGRLLPTGPGTTPTAQNGVTAGSEVVFLASNSAQPSQGAQIWCAVADIDPAGHGTGHPFLAVNSDTDSFSLCPINSRVSVVYNATTGRGYDLDACYPVKLQLIF
ncbi:hypothetical protein DICSQDRAFT_112382 [Dichomitus squalens LYAD-421 SS1]|uniref:Uncharacterized protein n=1 Tax=Dichomitus squalens (strain LYAD-421) TaxID=732165 RepID=R7SLB7_DICSQ|nr:uncharacterized protein DICSQDRAFT_112382 [Dichomitus squalens LYAD-421 SS1]EJF56934.1 hypothetical protein DICSQDRAFT_112382 [Dichomitus squalens LYAD-421 SS1]